MSTQNFDNDKHNVLLYGRQRITITGVTDVVSFDENEIVTIVSDGSILTVEGKELNIAVLDTDKGCVEGQGIVYGIYYSDTSEKVKTSILSKIFRGK